MSKKEKFIKRITNVIHILIPLIFSTLDRIELISNAMDLRSFGKYKTRTWYTYRKLSNSDYISIIICILIFISSLLINSFINHGMYFNPFI